MLTFLLLTMQALAFQPTVNAHGAEMAWQRLPVAWAYADDERPNNVGTGDVHAAISGAFETWNAVPGANVWLYEAEAEDGPAEENVVFWVRDWPYDPDVLALTSTWSTSDGAITRFQIAINARHPWSTAGESGSYDLQNMLTHEIGHALGLDHDLHHHDATMAPTAARGETRKRHLHHSDEDGVRYLYPGDPTFQPAHATPELMACASVDARASWLALGLVPLAMARRRKEIAA